MSDPLPPPPETPAANTRSRTLRLSTVAAGAKRPVPSLPQHRAKPSKPKQTTKSKHTKSKHTKSKHAKKAASPILIPQYVESASSEEEGDEDEPFGSEFTFRGRVFRRATDFATQQQRQKSSHVWDKDKGFEIIDVKAGTRHYYCIQCCDKEKDEHYAPFAVDNGTSSVTKHWKTKHGIDKHGNPVKKNKKRESLINLVDFKIWKLVFIQWIVTCHIAYSQIENRFFKKMLSLLGEGLAALVPSRNTIRKWIVAEFQQWKKELRRELRAARSNIHISFDLWTSPNCYAIMAIVAHYIDSNGKRQAKLIALRSIDGEHTGENMAALLLKVFQEYKIGSRIGFFITDNASSNDVCIDLVLSKLYPDMNAKQRLRRRLRCLGHVVNLAAQAFLFGKQSQETLDELDLAYRKHDYEAIAKAWRKQGVLGRLHNIIRYIRMTPQRRAEWRKTVVATKEWSFSDGLEVSPDPAIACMDDGT
jgi:hypothetical protein